VTIKTTSIKKFCISAKTAWILTKLTEFVYKNLHNIHVSSVDLREPLCGIKGEGKSKRDGGEVGK